MARDNLELLLRRFGLNPIILQRLPAAGDTIIEKLEQYIGKGGERWIRLRPTYTR